MIVNIKRTSDNSIVPTRGSDSAAGYDLYADILKGQGYSIIVHPRETVKIGTGITMEIPDGYFGAVFARSGLATKQGLRPANCVGVIDSDYRGEIIVALYNDSDDMRVVSYGDRIAQIVIMPYGSIEFNEVNNLRETDRGNGGFGSTEK